MTEKITSLNNPRIKNILHLAKAGERRDQGLIVIEGFREIRMALESGIEIRELYVAPDVGPQGSVDQVIAGLNHSCSIVEISRNVFEKAAYRGNSDGLIALAAPRHLTLSELRLGELPLLLVLESPEKPGNLGAILRTADAAALDAVIVCDPKTDLYNANVIRASLGCVFSCQVAICTSAEAIGYLKGFGISTCAAALTAEQFYYEADFTLPCAIVMGSEADGLTALWLDSADTPVKIPMGGKADSLNLSTSAAILAFEAKRQRACAAVPRS